MGLEDIEGVYLPKNFYMEGVDVKVRDNNLYVSGVIQFDNKKLVAVDDLLVKNSDGFELIPINPEPASLEDIAKYIVNPESLRCYELPGFEDGDKSIVKVLRDNKVFGEGSEVLRLEEGVYFVRDGFLRFKRDGLDDRVYRSDGEEFTYLHIYETNGEFNDLLVFYGVNKSVMIGKRICW
ncbi:hypothetical protein J7L02_00730, partial [Candidatus Woesearchaeota archaeon]|nr:hypothetical protein [Candidatus Woesearchaeota archaeon]